MVYLFNRGKIVLGVAGVLLIAAAPFWISSCSSSGSSSAGPQNYVGAGSQFNISIDSPAAGQFTLTHAAAVGGSTDLSITGNYASESTGFLLLTVTSVSGSGSGGVTAPSVGATAYGLQVPGYVFFLKPVGTNSPLIPMVPTGGCPPSSLALNWMVVKPPSNSSWSATSTTYGTFAYDTSSGAADVTSSYEYNGSSAGAQAVGSGGCPNNDGILTVSGTGGSNPADLFLTPSGGGIVHTGTANESSGGDQIIFAMPTPSSALTVTNLAGNYAGLVFQNATGGKNFPVAVTLAASGNTVTGTGSQLSDPTNASSGTGTVSITLSNPISGLPGFVTGTINAGSSQTLVCEAQTGVGSSSQNVLVCVGEDGSGNFFSVILASH